MTIRWTLLALSVAAGQSLAQIVVPTEDGVLEEIIVTAEHRKASLQETEIALTALTNNDIRDLAISNGTDLGQYVPNVTITQMAGSSLGYGLNIRGIGQNETIVTFDPSAGMYIDGVLIPKSPGALLDVLDMERIEVLRGPQGTLYGRNTIAGAINYITKKPSGEFEGRLAATVGSEGQREFKGMLNVPLLAPDSALGALNLRVSAASIEREGLTKNALADAPTREFENKDRNVVLAHLQWEPTDALRVRYSFDRSRIDESPQLQYVSTINSARPIGQLVAPYSVSQHRRPKTVLAGSPQQAELEVDGHALDVEYRVSEAMTFRSLTGYRESWSGGVNAGNTPFEVISTITDQTNDSFTQEFRLTGAVLDDRLSYSAGAFYMDEEGDVLNGVIVLGGTPAITTAEFENKNWAIYAQATYELTDKWSLTGGLRYTEEKREMIKAESLLPSGLYPRVRRSFDDISPMISIGYDWSENVNAYFKVSRGYQSGGFNVRDISPIDFVRGFEEEQLLAYELGVKATSPSGRLRANAAFWFSDYDDKRVNNFNPDTLGNVIRNAGVVEIYGMELEFLAYLTDDLRVGLDYGYTNAKYVKYDDGTGNDLSDVTSFPYTPEHTVHAYLGYSFPRMSFGAMSARVDWSWRDDITFLSPLPERNSGRSVGLLNARLTLDEIDGPGDTKFRVSLWGKNLTNEVYWNQGVNIFNTFGFDISQYGEPRLWGVDFEFAF